MCAMQYNAKVCMDEVFETVCHSISNVTVQILDAVVHSRLTMFDISEMVCSVMFGSFVEMVAGRQSRRYNSRRD